MSLRVTAPANFVGTDSDVQINQLSTSAVATPPAGKQLINNQVADIKIITSGSYVSSTDEPITVSMNYSSADATTYDENTFAIYRWNGSSWTQLNDCSVNTSTTTVACTTSSFSVFGLFGTLASSSNSSQSSSDSSNSSTSTNTCNLTPPGSKTPWLYAAVPQSPTSVKLYFTQADGPLDHYALEYGVDAGKYAWGSTNIGGQELRTYLVESLTANTTYYFRVRAGNGCAAGHWSNEISTATQPHWSFNQLIIPNTELRVVESNQDTPEANCSDYTVESGDNLWTIASTQLGDGSKYQDIINQNKSLYPTLENNDQLTVGWELKLNCTDRTELGGPTENFSQEVTGHIVRVQVTDEQGKPISGAKVTIHSEVQEAITNQDGIAEFKNVEQGDHRVIIAYNGYEGEQSVNLPGDPQEFELNITVQEKSALFSPTAVAVIGAMGIIILLLLFSLVKVKKR